MNIFVHQGKGHYIGSVAIVVADSEREAGEVVRSKLDEAGLKDEPLNIRSHVIAPSLVYFDNGDY